jgi:3-hydroxyisobutyrate dehydrogenase-like beta-hydroxyacid dehydrogenase
MGEAIALVRKSAVDPQQFLEVLNGLFNSPVYANYGKIIAEQRFEPAGFKLQLGLKDVGLALEAAHDSAVPMPLASLLRDHYWNAIAHGRGFDFQASTYAQSRAAASRYAGSSGAASLDEQIICDG